MLIKVAFVLVVAAAFGSRASAQQVTKQAVPGVQNFAKLETTVACGGATTPEAVPESKKMGYASIINLRLPSEAGANVDGEAAAAKTARFARSSTKNSVRSCRCARRIATRCSARCASMGCPRARM